MAAFVAVSKTYQAAADEEDGDGDMLEVLCRPWATGASKMLEEDVRTAIGEDHETLDELGRRLPFLAVFLGAKIPGLHQVR